MSRKSFFKSCAAVVSAAVLTASVSLTPTVTLSASAAETEGVIPSRLYGVRIVDTDDYITAVRHTIQSTAAVRDAEDDGSDALRSY